MLTEADRDRVDRAILEIARGHRVQSITTGDRSMSYQNPTLDQLEALRARIGRDLSAAKSGSRVIHLRTSKGL